MKILDREIPLRSVPRKVVEILTMGFRSAKFKNPYFLWKSFLYRESPPKNRFDLRDGSKIMLSDNPHDAITVMVIYCKLEYGGIEPGSTVIDIGANIGVFTLFAASSGASKIFSFEPNSAAFSTLSQNIEINEFGSVVHAFKLAVGARNNEIVYLPFASSPYNKSIKESDGIGALEPARTISLEQIIEENEIDEVSYLKLDCEGAEYEIFMNCPAEVFSRIRRIRMELHYSSDHSREELIDVLVRNGFSVVKRVDLIVWLDRQT